MLFETRFYKHVLLVKEKMHIAKMRIFSKFRVPSFLHCVFYHLRHGRQKKKMRPGSRFQGFWDFLGHFEVQGARNCWFGMRHKIAGFCHVLSVSVVPSVSVERAMESNDVVMTCFGAVSLSGTMRSAMSVLLEETAFGGHASLKPADPSIADVLEHHTAACPRPMIHAGQKCRQFCGLAGAGYCCTLSSFHKKESKGERSGKQGG